MKTGCCRRKNLKTTVVRINLDLRNHALSKLFLNSLPDSCHKLFLQYWQHKNVDEHEEEITLQHVVLTDTLAPVALEKAEELYQIRDDKVVDEHQKERVEVSADHCDVLSRYDRIMKDVLDDVLKHYLKVA